MRKYPTQICNSGYDMHFNNPKPVRIRIALNNCLKSAVLLFVGSVDSLMTVCFRCNYFRDLVSYARSAFTRKHHFFRDLTLFSFWRFTCKQPLITNRISTSRNLNGVSRFQGFALSSYTFGLLKCPLNELCPWLSNRGLRGHSRTPHTRWINSPVGNKQQFSRPMRFIRFAPLPDGRPLIYQVIRQAVSKSNLLKMMEALYTSFIPVGKPQ